MGPAGGRASLAAAGLGQGRGAEKNGESARQVMNKPPRSVDAGGGPR